MRAAAPNLEMHFLGWNSQLPTADLVINTTPAGVADIFVGRLQIPKVFFEALYNPWPTKLLQYTQSNGSFGIDGLDLLIQQGIDQLALMTGLSIDGNSFAPDLRATCLAKMGRSS